MEQGTCYIEHHAVMYALIAKEAAAYGEEGNAALERAAIAYGENRGKRMASCAVKEGLEPDSEAYFLFGEWRPKEGTVSSVEEEVEDAPTYTTKDIGCEWVNSWKRYGLLEYGKSYCVHIDTLLYESFQQPLKNRLTVHGLQSAGDSGCIFEWGYVRAADADQVMAERRKKIGDKYVRTFDFLVADLLYVISDKLIQDMGDTGRVICKKAWDAFGETFGETVQNAVLAEVQKQGWKLGFLN